MAITRSTYDQALVDKICAEMADGKSLRAACKGAGRPDRKTFLRWVEKHEAVEKAYVQAIADREERYFEEIIEIADGKANPSKTRVQVDARKWVLARMNPKKYGDRMTNELTGAGGGPIESNMTIQFVSTKPKADAQ
jgi:uncharacterized protein (DUF2336 family)